MSLRILPLTLSEEEFILRVRETFALTEPPFSSISDSLLLLAFTADCNSLSSPLQERLLADYGVCDFQTLEFFGDRVLYDVVSVILYDIFGLATTPNFLSKATSFLTSNRTLTDIMLNKGACVLVRSSPYFIREERVFHNSCSDSFEALIGALFVHLLFLELDHSIYITEWILKNTALPTFLEEYLRISRYPGLIYYPVTKEELARKVGGERKDFARDSLFLDIKLPLEEIYRKLGWEEGEAIPLQRGDVYLLYGYPRGVKKVIAQGKTAEEAKERGKVYLVDMGYIIPLKEAQRRFSRI